MRGEDWDREEASAIAKEEREEIKSSNAVCHESRSTVLTKSRREL